MPGAAGREEVRHGLRLLGAGGPAQGANLQWPPTLAYLVKIEDKAGPIGDPLCRCLGWRPVAFCDKSIH